MSASFLRRMRAPAGGVALFGGTFDPIHAGHLAVARAAQRRFRLNRLLFIPSGRPPHKQRADVAPYPHRFAMVALACAGHPRFVPSLAEAGRDLTGREVFYSIDTVRRFRRQLRDPGDRLYFLLGADSFLEIRTWKNYKALLDSCDFIVASRPGFRLEALRLVIPPELFARPSQGGRPDPRAIPLRRTTVYLLDTVSSHVSATEVRRRLDRGRSIHRLVPARVEEYISKQALYR